MTWCFNNPASHCSLCKECVYNYKFYCATKFLHVTILHVGVKKAYNCNICVNYLLGVNLMGIAEHCAYIPLCCFTIPPSALLTSHCYIQGHMGPLRLKCYGCIIRQSLGATAQWFASLCTPPGFKYPCVICVLLLCSALFIRYVPILSTPIFFVYSRLVVTGKIGEKNRRKVWKGLEDYGISKWMDFSM